MDCSAWFGQEWGFGSYEALENHVHEYSLCWINHSNGAWFKQEWAFFTTLMVHDLDQNEVFYVKGISLGRTFFQNLVIQTTCFGKHLFPVVIPICIN